MSLLQERDVQRYYQPWLAAHGSSLNVARHVDSLAQLDLQKQGYQPKTSRDKAITAFAQLVALRLDVRRCMVSLIDAHSQYVLAEATRSHSATKDVGKDGDELWLGSSILARADAMCEHCMVNACSAVEDDGGIYSTKGLIVPDCRLDDRFKTRPYVVQEPGVRFYAGVPLYSRSGYMIGAIAVSDESPRDGLQAEQLRLMQETAQNVMEHLEWARDRVDRFKGERIVRGMASFIEDCSLLRDGPIREDLDEKTDVVGKAGAIAEASPVTHKRPRSRASNRPPLFGRQSAKRLETQSQKADNKVDGMSRMFAVASEVLRDSTLADGAAIFGATADTGRTPNIRAMPANLDGVTEKSAGTIYGQPSSGSESDRHDTNTSDSDSVPAARPCKILAFSVADEQARAGIESGTALTLATLEKYFALFPQGKTFSFTEEGSGISSEEESDAVASASEKEPENAASNATPGARTRARLRKRRMDHKELLKKIPGAKTVIFLPLYDHAEEKLVAGCFLWTSVTGRMLQDADLSYLRAFGNCVVSEVIRMNMQKNEAAKTTFIASMSHELRSPLHGILGAAEFLMDTTTDAYQSGLVTSIVTCGRTLLDTLNHVLDYSKINKLGRTQMRRRAKANRPINLASDSSLESLNLTADVDLGTLVEEVAEAVTAGHTFKNLPDSAALANAKANAGTGQSFDTLTAGQKDLDRNARHVSVLLDISPRRSWMVRIQPGALRRIIMNLLGNALKYTSTGFVAVSLRAQETTDSTKTKALIRVVDSGKGMSDAFQRDRLFVPFSQEDPFQPGTGLGLSIVKQIVDSLGGSIEVRSEQGIGTEVDVHLSLPPAASTGQGIEGAAPTQVQDLEMISIEARTRGCHLVLLDPTNPDFNRSPTSPVARFQQTLREICTSWFGMRVSASSNMNVSDADIYIYCEPPSIEKLRDHNRQAEDVSTKVPIVIVCMNDQDAVSMTRDQQSVLRELGRIVEVIPQPCGPRKLAKAFHHCLRRADEARDEARKSDASFQSIEYTQQNGTNKDRSTPAVAIDAEDAKADHRPEDDRDQLRQSISAAVSYPAPMPIDPATPSLQSPQEQQKQLSRNSSSSDTSAPTPALAQIHAPHLLLVDDNKINRQLLVMFMERCKFTYREAENGQEALDIYRAANETPPQPAEEDALGDSTSSSSDKRRAVFDFVLMDISMPIMDGMEATKRIREFEKEMGLRKTTVIALTGLASEKAREEAETVGIDVFLPKPVKFAELKGLLNAGR